MNEATRILSQLNRGDSQAAERLLTLVYDELRRLAQARMLEEHPGHTLQATALVHEAYLRLVGGAQNWEGKGHFFSAAAEAMRRILIESGRRKGRLKRGGRQKRVELDDLNLAVEPPMDEIAELDDAISRLALEDRQAAELVRLRFYAGLSVEEAAQALGTSRATAYRDWTYARAWIRSELEDASLDEVE